MLRGFELLLACVSRLEEIGAAAAKEFSLEKAMEKMKLEWRDLVFEFLPYREGVSSQLSSFVTHAVCKYKKDYNIVEPAVKRPPLWSSYRGFAVHDFFLYLSSCGRLASRICKIVLWFSVVVHVLILGAVF